MANNQGFSVIIPTHSGVSTLDNTFKSIFDQKKSQESYEIVVVIDGPNKSISKITGQWQSIFQKAGIPYMVKTLPQNRGRFEARLIGAKLAKNDQLLFVDDRVTLAPNFFQQLAKIKHSVAIPNVIEKPSSNPISSTLFILRKRVYSQNWGQTFNDQSINKESFESSPKGTTSLWIQKELFIDICQELKATFTKTTKYVNEDTKILRAIVDKDNLILRTSKLNIYYQPRSGFLESAKHLYERGPRFVDYYKKPGTRFFPLLLAIYAAIFLLIVTIIIKPQLIIYYLLASITILLLANILLVKTAKDYFIILLGLPMVVLIFSAGVVKGSIVNFIKPK